MLIGIISDSHDNLNAVKKATGVFSQRGVKILIHAGDIVSPFVTPLLSFAGLEKIYAVFGNNDGEYLGLTSTFSTIGEIKKPPFYFKLANKKIVILHEPWEKILMENAECDILIYGHLHQVKINRGKRNNKPLIINSGECCGYISGKSTVVILDLETEKYEVIEL